MAAQTPKIVIHLVHGDMVSIKANIGVFSVGSKESFGKGELSNYIVEKSGSSLAEEFNQVTRQLKDLKLGQLVRLSAHQLKDRFDQLIAVTLYSFIDGNEEDLEKSIKACLKIASDTGYDSIVFPALGMKGNRYPPFLVAMATVKAICEFTAESQETTLKTVYISLHNNSEAAVRTFLQTVIAYMDGRKAKRDVVLKGVQAFAGLERTF